MGTINPTSPAVGLFTTVKDVLTGGGLASRSTAAVLNRGSGLHGHRETSALATGSWPLTVGLTGRPAVHVTIPASLLGQRVEATFFCTSS